MRSFTLITICTTRTLLRAFKLPKLWNGLHCRMPYWCMIIIGCLGQVPVCHKDSASGSCWCSLVVGVSWGHLEDHSLAVLVIVENRTHTLLNHLPTSVTASFFLFRTILPFDPARTMGQFETLREHFLRSWWI